jgi:hypothetical protein
MYLELISVADGVGISSTMYKGLALLASFSSRYCDLVSELSPGAGINIRSQELVPATRVQYQVLITAIF